MQFVHTAHCIYARCLRNEPIS